MITLTATQKLYAAALAIGALGWWQAHRLRNSLVGVCVEGGTGPTACGGDVPVEGNGGPLQQIGGFLDGVTGWFTGTPAAGNTGTQDPSYSAPRGDLGQSEPIGGGITWGTQGPNTESWP